MFTIEANFDLVGFEKEVIDLLNKMSMDKSKLGELGEMIVTDIKEGIDRGEDLSGSPFVSNTFGWIKRKGNTTVFKGKTNRLFNSIKVKSVTDNSVEVSVKSGGVHWQTNPGNQYKSLPQFKRDFFGFSNRLLRKIDEWLRKN